MIDDSADRLHRLRIYNHNNKRERVEKKKRGVCVESLAKLRDDLQGHHHDEWCENGVICVA